MLICSALLLSLGLGGHASGSFEERGGEHLWLRDAPAQPRLGDLDPELASFVIAAETTAQLDALEAVHAAVVEESSHSQGARDCTENFRHA